MKIEDSKREEENPCSIKWEKQEVYPLGRIGITNQADGQLCAMLRDVQGKLWMQRELGSSSILSEWKHISEREETMSVEQSQILLALHKRDGRLVAIEGRAVRDYWFGLKTGENEAEGIEACGIETCGIGGWSKVEDMQGDHLAVCERCSGAIELFLSDSAHHLWHRWTNLQYDWSEWKALGGWAADHLVVVNNREGFPQVLVRGADQSIWVIRHADTGMWGEWLSLGGEFTGEHAAIVGLDGMISVVAAGVDGIVYLCQQKETLDHWTSWVKLGHLFGKELLLFYNKEQVLMVIVLDEQGCAWSREITDTNASDWKQLGESILHLQSGSLSNGETVLFGVKVDGCLYELFYERMK